ncbi:nucleotide-sugar transporter-domain-containing protein [Mycena rosella]|uniref:Nucleotide-sugar transporter-domain-containing protein n=1 Tax=Mycena rosella TaxID=1033263 RepID=A0AAD7GAC1_MYCRO|nr:nucleotide-sugar transporter-domain-containing protein [Mycena rosella]
MDLGSNFSAKLGPFLLMAKSLKGAATAKLIADAASAPGVFLSPTKWLSLFFFAIGVGIDQILTSTLDQVAKNVAVGSAHDSAPLPIRVMSPLTGFGAVIAACFTSGLARVYFGMVLKNPRADLWVRIVQLSLFSIIPALLPVLYSKGALGGTGQRKRQEDDPENAKSNLEWTQKAIDDQKALLVKYTLEFPVPALLNTGNTTPDRLKALNDYLKQTLSDSHRIAKELDASIQLNFPGTTEKGEDKWNRVLA